MGQLTNFVSKLKIRKDTLGQDLIEYALLGGLLAFGAGVVLPSVTDTVNNVFNRVTSVLLVVAQEQGPGASN
jgi:Flp pilus assembly pilin Flp